MCPFCWSTIGLVVAGTVSTGGLAALAVKISHSKERTPKHRLPKTKEQFQ